MTLSRRFAMLAAVVFVAAGTLSAQATEKNTAQTDPTVAAAPAVDQTPVAAPAAEPVSLAPLASNASVGVKSFAPASPTPYTPKPEHVGSNVALMIIGGAVLIVGAVVGGTAGTIIMLGGAAVGIVGLYRYLQ